MLQFLIIRVKKGNFLKEKYFIYISDINKDFKREAIMTHDKKRFTVITNEKLINKEEHKATYQTNPIVGQHLLEQLAQFRQKERFTVEELLKW